ncbi:hypothetical protein JB92DRAFT_3076807 [Gautieria morchelliformis]|nr:hypothetical protein JB92DRAFT_3076807 [Gautieria morchelliformis]
MASQQSVDIQAMSDKHVALLAYDTLLTLPSEITYIWRRRVRLGTVLYLLARYPAFLNFIIGVYVDIANIPLQVSGVCNPLVLLAECLAIMIPGIEGLLSARVYAMSQHNQGMPWVLGALGLLYMGSLGTGVFFLTKEACNLTGPDITAINCCGLTDHLFQAATIHDVFLILFGTLVVVVTLYNNTLGLVRRSREFPMLPQKSLTRNLAEQTAGITSKVLYDVQFHETYLTFSITGVKTARQIHDSLMEEFGDPSIEEIGTSEANGPHREDDPSSNAVLGIELEEIPRAGTCKRYRR